MKLVKGARIRVRTRDSVGAPVRAKAGLNDAEERPLRISFLQPIDDKRWALAHQTVDGRFGSILVPVLAPGTYTLRLTAKDRDPQSQTFTVKAGETRLLEFDYED